MLNQEWHAMIKKYLLQLWWFWELILLMKLSKLSMQANMETVVPFSQNQEETQENSNMKLKLDRSVSIFQSQYLYQCSVLLEIKIQCGEPPISMVKELLTSIPNGKLSLPDGRKKTKMLISSQLPCQFLRKIEGLSRYSITLQRDISHNNVMHIN